MFVITIMVGWSIISGTKTGWSYSGFNTSRITLSSIVSIALTIKIGWSIIVANTLTTTLGVPLQLPELILTLALTLLSLYGALKLPPTPATSQLGAIALKTSMPLELLLPLPLPELPVKAFLVVIAQCCYHFHYHYGWVEHFGWH